MSGWTKNLSPAPTIKEPTQPGKQRSVRRSQGRSGHVGTEHGNLVAEHHDFNDQIAVIAPAQTNQLEDSDKGKIQK